MSRAGEPGKFLSGSGSWLFFKWLRLQNFFPSGSGSGSLFFFKRLRLLVFFHAALASAPRSQKHPAPAPQPWFWGTKKVSFFLASQKIRKKKLCFKRLILPLQASQGFSLPLHDLWRIHERCSKVFKFRTETYTSTLSLHTDSLVDWINSTVCIILLETFSQKVSGLQWSMCKIIKININVNKSNYFVYEEDRRLHFWNILGEHLENRINVYPPPPPSPSQPFWKIYLLHSNLRLD